MILWKCHTQYASKFGRLSNGHRSGKGQFSFQSQRKAMSENVQSTSTIVFISYVSKVMLKVLQARLQQYVNLELADAQARFRKGRGTRDQITNIRWFIKKAREFQKNICFVDYVGHKTLENSLRDGNTNHWPAYWEICTQVKKQQLELDMEQ